MNLENLALLYGGITRFSLVGGNLMTNSASDSYKRMPIEILESTNVKEYNGIESARFDLERTIAEQRYTLETVTLARYQHQLDQLVTKKSELEDRSDVKEFTRYRENFSLFY